MQKLQLSLALRHKKHTRTRLVELGISKLAQTTARCSPLTKKTSIPQALLAQAVFETQRLPTTFSHAHHKQALTPGCGTK